MKLVRARIITLLLMVAALGVARFASAASFGISPATGTYEVGKTVTVTVSATSSDKSVNAFSGTIKYPKDVLEYVGVSTGKSVVDQWLPPGSKGPSIRTSDGVINFEGVSISGTTGSSELFKVTFKVKKTGTAELSFSSGSILANDGLGTDVLTAYGKGVYTLEPATIIPPKPAPETQVTGTDMIEVPAQTVVPVVPTQETMALRELVDQMKLLMTFAKFVLGAIMVLAIVLIILAIYLIHLAVWTKRRSRMHDRV